MKVKEQSEKVGLKLNIQKTNIKASGPITSWQIDGETVETVTDYFLRLQEVTELNMEKWTGSKLGKQHINAVNCCLLIQLICRVNHAKRWAR